MEIDNLVEIEEKNEEIKNEIEHEKLNQEVNFQ